MSPRSSRLAAVAAVLSLAAACGGGEDWRQLPAGNLEPRQQAQQQRAEAARDALAASLLAELGRALKEGGATGAIAVCRDAAPRLAAAVAAEQRLRIGRTSSRLRNPANRMPAWAGAAAAAEPVLFAGPAGELGALYPIRLQPQCVQCHGQREQLAAEVQAKLQELYPQDQATGFQVGDLRGWFWVEVPGDG